MSKLESLTGRAEAVLPTETRIPNEWAGTDSAIGDHVQRRTCQCLDAYRANPLLVTEHANIERAAAQGGYGRRQIYELVQNGADALLGTDSGRIHVLLTDGALYCANEGKPITPDGADSILSSHISDKRGVEIGRFGLGFKSVLGVSSRPEFYSLTGSFCFDARDAEARIREIVPDAERYPVLRVARSLEPREAAKDDPILADLMQWATTVVKLPRDLVSSEWLSEDIAAFPAHFVLFSPHVGKLVLEDRVGHVLREIQLLTKGNLISLEEDGASSQWQIFSTNYIPSEAARKDAGALADRESLPIMWAVPLQGKASAARGQFWAFFPTEYVTTLSGIVNAPWKTNEDRQNLLTGLFNEELIRAAAQLVASALSSLETDDDPGRFLDLMPARGREAPNWADLKLTELVYPCAADEAIVPDQNGVRRRTAELRLHPAGMPHEALDAWAGYPGRPANWCHHSVDTRDRRPRIERLHALKNRYPEAIRTWLEAIAADGTPEGSLAAIGTAAAILQAPTTMPSQRLEIEASRILLTSECTLVRVQPGTAFIAVDHETSHPAVAIVHEYLSKSEEGRAALAALKIGEVEPSSELQALLATGSLVSMTDARWEAFWRLVARVPFEAARGLLAAYLRRNPQVSLRVRTVSGAYRPLESVLLPGDIVPYDGSRDGDVAVDAVYHASVLPLLFDLGAVSSPKPGGAKLTERWYRTYRTEARGEFLKRRPRGSSVPQERLLVFDISSTAGPLDAMFALSEEGKARFTARLLLVAADEPKWTLYHESRREHYPDLTLDPPPLWATRHLGRLHTSLGIRTVGDSVGPSLREWERFVPVADVSETVSELLGLPRDDSALSPQCWKSALSLAESVDDDALLARFYAMAARHISRPRRIRCRLGASYGFSAPSAVAVAREPDEASALAQSEIPFLRADTQLALEALVTHWHLRPARDLITVSVYAAPSGPEMPLLDRFPGLDRHLSEGKGPYGIVPCSALRLDTTTARGKVGEDKRTLRDGNLVYFVDTLSDADLLDEIRELLGIPLSPQERAAILEQRELNELRERIVDIRTKATRAEKLLAAVGSQAIHRRLPMALISAAEELYGVLSDLRSAELALAGYGVETLHEFRDDLSLAGLNPPVQWAGSHSARRFVHDLGFPKEYAGFQESRRDAVLEVDGPPQLPSLHPFQETIVGRIRDLLDGRTETRRALLSLPTGAGKTRIAVESLVRTIAHGHLSNAVLWIAQTDELCEQAVQTWSEIWRGLGPRRRLHINRLWASNEADSYEDAAQVVVATDAKLVAACIDNPSYEWLREAGCVVIDEAHIATQPSYTAILEWLGLQRGSDRCPLVGLTATPFRGGEESTKFLVGRFGHRRLDADVLGEDPYEELQDMGVLARVDHRLLRGSAPELSAKELEELRSLHALPASVVDRIGADTSRNRVLLDSIRSDPPDWPVLLFAASVDHAYAMAALLSAEGIPSAAISSATDAGARRHYVEQFRKGALRVLANYAVLTAGFDAPSVRALYVARPTYSPGLYQQMIGRGLRGPLNGGKERCLIVNVEDNIVQYGKRLAFRQFEYLWESK